jgi:dUTP pyrophosphatase
MKFVKLSHSAHIPTRGTKGSAGYDFYAPTDCTIKPGEQLLIPTGVAWTGCPDYLVGILKDRSSMAHKKKCHTLAGVIDSDYDKKNIGFILRNFGPEPVNIKAGTRIGQMVIMQRFLVDNDYVVEETREGGYGSTGE